MKNLSILICAFLLSFLVSCQKPAGNTYYLDCENGSDEQSGLYPEEAWKTLKNINSRTFQAGDNIRLRAGCEWTGTLVLKGSGEEGRPIIVNSYDEGVRPVLHGTGAVNCTPNEDEPHYCTIFLNNQEYWIIRDIEITNYNAAEEDNLDLANWEKQNIDSFVNVHHPRQFQEFRSLKSGILVHGKDYGAVKGLSFVNLRIHGINGNIKTKHNGGIYMNILGEEGEKPTYFDGLLIDSCYIHDVDRTGISNSSYYENRSVDSLGNWTPSLNYIVRNSRFERTGANALILRVADKPLIEHNLFDHCAIKESGNAFFNFNTDSALMQFNEGRYTKYNVGDHDAGGIDSDFRTRWTILQYNYIHDNDFGPLVTGGPKNGFNEGTIVRFNIFENDGITRDKSDGRLDYSFKISGNATNTIVHNNVFRIGPSQANRAAVYHKNWGGYPHASTYFNNIFINDGRDTYHEMTQSTENHFQNNVIANQSIRSWPPADGQLFKVSEILNSAAGRYMLTSDSPLRRAGIKPIKMPHKDFYGNTIDPRTINIGIDQQQP